MEDGGNNAKCKFCYSFPLLSFAIQETRRRKKRSRSSEAQGGGSSSSKTPVRRQTQRSMGLDTEVSSLLPS